MITREWNKKERWGEREREKREGERNLPSQAKLEK